MQCPMCGVLLLVLLTAASAAGWTSDDISLYDLVDELGVGNTFYDFLEVPQDAPLSDIKRAYRKLSLVYHPDKNKAEDAAEKFNQLAAIYEIMKSDELRQRYNDVLEFGLPDWRQPVFYYRNLRRMPLWESVVILGIIITVAQYLMMWGAYFEQTITIRSRLERQERKLRQKVKASKKLDFDVDEMMEQYADQLHKPNWKSLLPFWHRLRQLEKEAQRQAEQAALDDDAKPQRPHKERVFIEPVEFELAKNNKPVSTSIQTAEPERNNATQYKTGPWTLDELNYLVRLSTTKYPVGTPSRWEKIAEAVSRKPELVTNMIGKLKHIEPSEYHKLCQQSCPAAAPAVNPAHNDPSMATDAAAKVSAAADWTQNEQKQLEAALIQFPKTVVDRWEKIADCIPGRNKEECVDRFKYLASMLRQRKTQKSQA